MKVLIWLGCALIYSVISSAARSAGFVLGGLPTVIIVGNLFWLAARLCKSWDNHKEQKNKEQIREHLHKTTYDTVTVKCPSCGKEQGREGGKCALCGTPLV